MPNSLNDVDLATTLERLFPEIERVWAAEVDVQAKKRTEADQLAMESLRAVWDEVVQEVFGQLDAVFSSLKKAGLPKITDPLRSPLDLLRPLGLERHEPTHTQALRFLLDPTETHGLGRTALNALLRGIARRHPITEQLINTAERAATVEVQAERVTHLSEEPDGKLRRPETDLWLEMSGEPGRVLLVIENKVDDVVREGQLEAYEKAIMLRLGRLGAEWTALRVLLSPDGEGDGAWLGLSFLDLAGALSAGLRDTGTEGETFLRLYVTSILRGIYRLQWRESPSRAEQVQLVQYLESQQEVTG